MGAPWERVPRRPVRTQQCSTRTHSSRRGAAAAAVRAHASGGAPAAFGCAHSARPRAPSHHPLWPPPTPPPPTHPHPDPTLPQVMKSPPASYFIKKAAGLSSGSQKPGHQVAGAISLKHLHAIAEIKQRDTPHIPLPSIVKALQVSFHACSALPWTVHCSEKELAAGAVLAWVICIAC